MVQVDQQNNILSHEEILEEEKDNQFSLGKKLRISDEEFEDLDEIIARYVEPMVSSTARERSFQGYKLFVSCFTVIQLLTSYNSSTANQNRATLSN